MLRCVTRKLSAALRGKYCSGYAAPLFVAVHTMAEKARKGELFDEFADDLLAERGVRPLIIVGASKVDDALVEILRRFLLPKISKANGQDELLDGARPLGTFSARIKTCRRLGLIDETLYCALERLRSVRNLCAHSIWFDASKSPARDHLAELSKHVTNRRSYKLTKERYFNNSLLQPIEEWQCLLLTLCVLLEAIREKVKSTRGSKVALRIAAK